MASQNTLSHFYLPKDLNGKFKAKCKHCVAEISGSLKVTSNFVTHMKRKHREILLERKHIQGPSKSSDQDQSACSLDTFVTKAKKYSNSDSRQHQITDALLHFVAGNLLPLSTIESEEFKTLMAKCDSRYQVPSRKHFTTKLLKEKSTEVQNNVKHQLQRAQSVCLTIDLWSNRQMRGFMGITGHYILDWTMKSVMICCKRVRGKHSAENIRNEYEEAIACFGIGCKIAAVVSDNASNMVKAFSLPGFENMKSDDKNDDDVDEDDDRSECCDDESESESLEEQILTDSLPTHSRCYAHTLQLVVKDGLKQCSSHLKNIIAKASNIVSFVRRSISASDILENEARLQAANATRWNSQLIMLRSILKVPEEKLNKVECRQTLSTYERKLLSELCSILEPFEHATVLVQKESNVSGSLTIPVTLGLEHQLALVEVNYSSKMISALKSSIQSRLSHYKTSENYILASLLDPRFKTVWCKGTDLHNNVSLLKQKVDHLISISKEGKTIDDSSDESPPPAKKIKTEDFFSFLPTTPSRKRHHSGLKPNEVDIYIGEDCTERCCDPLQFWKDNSCRFPNLSILASKYLAIPATSAPVERLFSVAGKVFRPDRNRLSDDNFQTLMMIKCNSKI
ncbi:zinc finger BED domain-containing protein 4-like [Argopecten irradians]|uniref:zinc finger BED domain-containing protein 4-like n=1 Tax=Argopecten irradians TaxID=31199 RepID=UPI00371D2969